MSECSKYSLRLGATGKNCMCPPLVIGHWHIRSRAGRANTKVHTRSLRPHVNMRRHLYCAGVPVLLVSIVAAVSATSAAVVAANLSSASLSPPIPETIPFTTSTVEDGLPGSAARTFPLLSTTKTPRVVPLGAFFSPIALIRVAAGSQRSGYGRFCFVLKVVFALGESLLKP